MHLPFDAVDAGLLGGGWLLRAISEKRRHRRQKHQHTWEVVEKIPMGVSSIAVEYKCPCGEGKVETVGMPRW